jgi:hypothetical protein
MLAAAVAVLLDRYLAVEGGRIGRCRVALAGPGLGLDLLHRCFLSLVATPVCGCLPRRSRELGVLRIGKIAGLAVQSVLRWVIGWRASSVREVIPSLVNNCAGW